MAGRTGTAEDREALLQVAYLLVSTALHAERAAFRSFPARWLVLWAVWRLNRVVSHFLVHSGAQTLTPRVPDWFRLGHGTADILELAASLRRLALALRLYAARIERAPTPGTRQIVAPSPSRDRGETVGQALRAASKAITISPSVCDTS